MKGNEAGSQCRVIAATVAGVLMLVGCGPAGTSTRSDAIVEPLSANVADLAETQPTSNIASISINEPAAATHPIPRVPAENPFATANAAVKRAWGRALAAYRIDDYATAATEFRELAECVDLTTGQKQAAETLLAEVHSLLPEPPTSAAIGTMDTPGTNQPGVPDSAWRESYRRALIAYRIEDYAAAVAGLEDLTAETTLPSDLKRDVENLLFEARRMLPDPPAKPTHDVERQPLQSRTNQTDSQRSQQTAKL